MCERLLPHQLDFDWRFTEGTAQELAGDLKGERVLLLGCPSVAEAIGASGKEAVLVDRQPSVTCSFSGTVFREDIRRGYPVPDTAPFSTIVFDSPWYLADVLLWLDVALRVSRPQTRILFSLWPAWTRPSAVHEIEQIFALLCSRGQMEHFPQRLRYRTPGFEHHSAVGIGSEWRFGDLVELIVSDAKPLNLPKPVLKKSWYRFAFDNQQIALRVRARQGKQPTLHPVFDSWYLPSVSRRQTNLDRIDIWSSDNEVGRVTSTRAFYQALRAFVEGSQDKLFGESREALTILTENGFVSGEAHRRRLEWIQFD